MLGSASTLNPVPKLVAKALFCTAYFCLNRLKTSTILLIGLTWLVSTSHPVCSWRLDFCCSVTLGNAWGADLRRWSSCLMFDSFGCLCVFGLLTRGIPCSSFCYQMQELLRPRTLVGFTRLYCLEFKSQVNHIRVMTPYTYGEKIHALFERRSVRQKIRELYARKL